MPSYPASASKFLGQTIDNGTLRIEAILGAGAFGVVYRAINIETGAQYAVERVEKEGNEYYQTREETAPFPCLVPPPYPRGPLRLLRIRSLRAGDLHSVIKKVVFFREDELIKRVFIQIIDALEYCHKRGVYHRDLKPENILVSALGGDMDVFVADFGLATTSKMSASACGTPCFMSPESLVAHHHPYSSAQGDVWALGCILAEMIGNVRPWSLAMPEDSDYSSYLMNRTVLFDKLPVSHTAYLLLRKKFSTKPELRPSLAAIRTEVLAMDTFFLTDSEVGNCGWGDRMEKQKLGKLRARGVVAPPTRRSSDTSSSVSYRFDTCSLGSSSGSRYPCGSSSSGFDSSSGDSIELPATPPAPVAEVVRTMDKASGLVLVPCVAAGHWQTC
ncbi:kinase-like domain-containing protein [Lactarius sanguifluus]|nr:kinase-like domain-containing protein [Lactarius sanguifluus]